VCHAFVPWRADQINISLMASLLKVDVTAGCGLNEEMALLQALNFAGRSVVDSLGQTEFPRWETLDVAGDAMARAMTYYLS